MKYSFVKYPGCYVLVTDFVMTETFITLINKCKGVESDSSQVHKYMKNFHVGHLFTPEEVQANLSKIIDAYILANPNADKAEDVALRQFAEENQQYKFLKNYKA